MTDIAKKRVWDSYSVARRVVKAGDLVEAWIYHDARHLRGVVPERRPDEQRVRRVDNSKRAKRRVRWLIEANGRGSTCYFFTATFAGAVTDYGAAVEVWARFRRLLVREFPAIRYVAVPEVQKGRMEKTGDAVWHFHAALFGLPRVAEMRSRYGRMLSQKGREVDAWMFHFTRMWSDANRSEAVNRAEITPVRSMRRLARYVTKYITKETGAFVPPDRRCYFAGGKNLLRPIVAVSRSLDVDENNRSSIPEKPPLPQGKPSWGVSRYDRYHGRVTWLSWRLGEKESAEYERALINAGKSGSVDAPTEAPGKETEPRPVVAP